MNWRKQTMGAALAVLLSFPFLAHGGESPTGGAAATPDDGPVDKEWQAALVLNGTFYEAFLRLPAIMKDGRPDQPDNVKLPRELDKNDYRGFLYYTKNRPLRGDGMATAKTPADMAKVAGRYVQVQDVMTDFGQLVGHVANGFHLVLNADGTGTYDKYGAIDGENYVKPMKWDGRKIWLTFPNAMEGHYTLDGNRLTYCCRLRGRMEEVHVFERESDFVAGLPLSPAMVLQIGGTPSMNAFPAPGPDLGKELDGQVYRLTRWGEGGKATQARASDPTTNPADHFVVLVPAGDNGGYGYFRNGDAKGAWFFPLGHADAHRGTKKDVSWALWRDTFFYWDKKDGVFEYWLIERPGYGAEKRYGRFELVGKTLKWHPRWDNDLRLGLCMEYELSEGEKPPVSHLAVGPASHRRSFGVPTGPRTQAGFWRLDRMQGYNDFVAPPPTPAEREQKQKELQQKILDLAQKDPRALQKIQEETFTYGSDVRKRGADLWYVLEPDGTGYMRVWDKYFDLVWDDDMIYYYDVSGRHVLSIGVGTLLGDKGGIVQVRLFKDETNPVPPRPAELGGQ